jgi:hypothetical protein
MLGFATSKMLDLLAARDASSNDLHSRIRRLDSRNKTPIRNGEREIIMLFLKAKRACHPAAAGVHFIHVKAGPPERCHCRSGSHQGLLMAVAMEEGFAAVYMKIQREPARVTLPE